MSSLQKLRLQSDSTSVLGDIVAEVLVQLSASYGSDGSTKTLLIQCVQTTGNAKDAESTWTPKDESTSNACGLTAGQWLRGPDGRSGGNNTLYGKLLSVDAPSAVLVKSDTLLPSPVSGSLKLGTSVQGVVAGVATDLAGTEVIHDRWSSFPGKVISQPTGETSVAFTTKSVVSPQETVHGLKCLHNCIVPLLMGTVNNPPQSNKVVHNYMEVCSGEACNTVNPSQEIKVPIENFAFSEYSWQPSSGLNFCGRPNVSSTASAYSVNQCTQSVAVPQGTMCQLYCYDVYDISGTPQQRCSCDNWSIKSTLFVGGSAADFKCRTTVGGTDSTQDKACLTHQSDYLWVPNVDNLDEYYEYFTGVPTDWSNTDTVWLETVEAAGTAPMPLPIEPPLLLTVEVPCSGSSPSISGIDYRCKKFIIQFSYGIDIWNSPGYPQWCFNKESGKSKQPSVDAYGFQQCVDWSNVDWNTFDYENDWYELYPDVNPELHWEASDSSGRKWGLKPGDKTLVYSQIPDNQCAINIVNPAELESDVERQLNPAVTELRSNVSSLFAWYRTHKDDETKVRVHTGTIII